VYIAEKIVYNISIIKKEEEPSMIKFEFQNPDHNDIWKFIIAFCMTQPEGTPNVDLQRMHVSRSVRYRSKRDCLCISSNPVLGDFRMAFCEYVTGVLFVLAMASLPVLMFI